ncbi:MAG TPA: SusD/RagB family nutrient-binding outer membrane lipoprotein [Saprospiraceae bacterium]|nr:SusD/RagB family nutrient-binding outer membrane lipoprotein [Saprospiraceae bacterium]
MKKILFKSIFAIALIFGTAACTGDFQEINTNPNSPTSVSSALLLPRIQRDVINTVLGEAWGIGNIVIQHTAKNQFVNEDRYLWGEINSIWNRVYNDMRDVNNIIRQSETLGQNNYKGIALVMKAWMFSLVTDCYGDVPYTEAGRGKEGFVYPKYDTQESIYNGILNDLKTANEILGSTGEVVQGDLIYNGDIQKWRRLANSLRVRYLMRISRKRNVAADLQSIIGDSKNPLFTGNGDNAVYTFLPNAPDQFPLFTTRIGSFNEFRASTTAVNALKALNDNRLFVFFRPTPATEEGANPVYEGILNGLGDAEALQYNGGPQNHSRIGELFFEKSITPQGIQVARGVIMHYAELQFLLAEAAEKGLISADPATFYTNGVKASFQYYGLTASDEYLNQPTVAYAGTQQEKLVKIGTQKWLAFFYTGLEAWFDWRRTGIPTITPGPSNQNGNRVPVRFIYPIIEQGLNGDNRAEAVKRQGPDDINTKMWYLQ